MQTSLIKAVILDWAGTSVDYGCIAPMKVFTEIFRKRGINLSLSEAREPMGKAKREHTRYLLNLPSVQEQWTQLFHRLPNDRDLDEIYSEIGSMLLSVVVDYSKPIPGLLDFVEELRSKNIKIGTTTGYEGTIMKNLQINAANHGFLPDSIVCSSDVPEGRPLPYMCYLSAIQMQVYSFDKMVKIGDTVADIEEGLNAGMWTIGLTKSGNEVGHSIEEIETMDRDQCIKLVHKAEQKLTEAGAHYVVEGIWQCLPILYKIEERIRNGEKP